MTQMNIKGLRTASASSKVPGVEGAHANAVGKGGGGWGMGVGGGGSHAL